MSIERLPMRVTSIRIEQHRSGDEPRGEVTLTGGIERMQVVVTGGLDYLPKTIGAKVTVCITEEDREHP